MTDPAKRHEAPDYRVLAYVVGTFVLIVVMGATVVAARPWWFFTPSDQFYGSSLTREVGIAGRGNCVSLASEGFKSCVISSKASGSYRSYVLRESGSKGCWTARSFDDSPRPGPGGRLGEETVSGCAGFTDTFAFYTDAFELVNFPEEFLKSKEFREWQADPS